MTQPAHIIFIQHREKDRAEGYFPTPQKIKNFIMKTYMTTPNFPNVVCWKSIDVLVQTFSVSTAGSACVSEYGSVKVIPKGG